FIPSLISSMPIVLGFASPRASGIESPRPANKPTATAPIERNSFLTPLRLSELTYATHESGDQIRLRVLGTLDVQGVLERARGRLRFPEVKLRHTEELEIGRLFVAAFVLEELLDPRKRRLVRLVDRVFVGRVGLREDHQLERLPLIFRSIFAARLGAKEASVLVVRLGPASPLRQRHDLL